MRIAVTGADGQLGRELCRQLGSRAQALDRRALDVTDHRSVSRVLGELRPDVVINTAALTAVDRAETEAECCQQVNAEAVAHLAEVCRGLNCGLCQISTDYVFGGGRDHRVPYLETDSPAPVNVYGKSKLQAEQYASTWDKHWIVRTCGLYATDSETNFVSAILRRLSTGQPLRVVDDQTCTPSYVPHVARAIVHLIGSAAYGTYHVVNQGATTWYEFASVTAEMVAPDVEVKPICSAEYGAPAPRPTYSVLDTGKYHTLGSVPLPHWQLALNQYLAAARIPAIRRG